MTPTPEGPDLTMSPGTCSILIPADPARSGVIFPGSAILATEQPGGGFLVDYEGDIYGLTSPQLPGTVGWWMDCLRDAAARHLNGYPSVARAIVPSLDGYMVVGVYRDGQMRLTDPGLVAQVTAWIRRAENARAAA
jgi:hypothetical protein